ncbi:SHOCT domain-containing protein [Shouchella patagoniensis]|uniref:SHOCT domain-containing protein n=1 Tax=Shouchella patagoniensis TaxID=228576 RepID=UPI001FE6BAEA|nr:SHOCT domain-containing protein [Shouchella patagoniensis]
MDKQTVFKGQGSVLTVKDNKITIKHGKRRQFADKTKPIIEVDITDIDSVVMIKPGITSGYFYLLRKGHSIGTLSKLYILGDEYAVALQFKPHYNNFLKAKALMEEQLISLQDHTKADVSEASRLYNTLLINEEKTLTFNGQTGNLIISLTSLTFEYNRLHAGASDKKTISIDKISGISLSKPGFSSGKIKINYEGFQRRGFGTLKTDENEIWISTISQYNSLLILKDLIEIIQSSADHVSDSNLSLSSADEIRKYKSLLDDGIISEEEFENKKQELLR